MPRIFLYYCLVAMGVGQLTFTLFRKRNFAEIYSFSITIASLCYLCEVPVLFVFSSYAYKLGVFNDPVAEDILGNLLMNGFFWYGTSVFVAAFSLSSLWILLIAAAYMLIEVLFIKAGAYELNWWRVYMTSAAVLLSTNIIHTIATTVT
ncbi:MAG: hypothetical protein Q8930_11550 [Bacillota bacterium]|nr:hypothetical protein [Bacillota bacterium]